MLTTTRAGNNPCGSEPLNEEAKKLGANDDLASERSGQGLDLLETRGWADRASGVIEA